MIGVLFLIALYLQVVRLRHHYRVPLGDGGFSALQVAIRIHGNSVETIPIALLLSVMMEINGAQVWVLAVLLSIWVAASTAMECTPVPYCGVKMQC